MSLFPEAIALEALNQQLRSAQGWAWSARPVDLSAAGRAPIEGECVDITDKAAHSPPRLAAPIDRQGDDR